MFITPPKKQQVLVRLSDLWNTEQIEIPQHILTESERGQLARAGELNKIDQWLRAIIFLYTLGDQLAQVGEVAEVEDGSAYVQEATRVLKENKALMLAAMGVLAAYAFDPDSASAPLAAPRRHAALTTCGCTDAYQRPLIETVRLQKMLMLPPHEWSPLRLQALPLIWSRQGVQPQRAMEHLLVFIVVDWLAQAPRNMSVFAQRLRALTAAFPAWHSEIRAREERARKAVREGIVAEHGLAPEAVFTLLATPIGPIRGQVIAAVHRLIQNPDDLTVDLGPHTATLRSRARAAHNALNL